MWYSDNAVPLLHSTNGQTSHVIINSFCDVTSICRCSTKTAATTVNVPSLLHSLMFTLRLIFYSTLFIAQCSYASKYIIFIYCIHFCFIFIYFIHISFDFSSLHSTSYRHTSHFALHCFPLFLSSAAIFSATTLPYTHLNGKSSLKCQYTTNRPHSATYQMTAVLTATAMEPSNPASGT